VSGRGLCLLLPLLLGQLLGVGAVKIDLMVVEISRFEYKTVRREF